MPRCGQVCLAVLAAILAAIAYAAYGIFNQPNHLLLSTADMVREAGYLCETHKIQTEDGYILTAFRIAGGKGERTARPVIWLQHGLTSSSDQYLLLGPGQALGLLLADKGYDVWIGNSRGSRYSLEHIHYTVNDPQFWDFSWDEMGKYDIPAALDYVLNVTKQEKLHYTGHSMGVAMLMVLLSTQPQYQERVQLVFALAPSVFMAHSRSLVVGFLCRHYSGFILNINGPGPFLPSNFPQFQNWFWPQCAPNNWASALCELMYTLTGGPSTDLNKDLLARFISTNPSQTSLKALAHYGQTMKSGEFRAFDYGRERNEVKYGSPKPLTYDLKKVTTPVVIMFAESDYIVTPRDEYDFCSNLTNVVEYYRIPLQTFDHMDFMGGMSAKKFVYNKILEILDKGPSIQKQQKAVCHKTFN